MPHTTAYYSILVSTKYTRIPFTNARQYIKGAKKYYVDMYKDQTQYYDDIQCIEVHRSTSHIETCLGCGTQPCPRYLALQ